MNLSSLQEFDSEVPKDEELTQLDVRRFRSNIIGLWPLQVHHSVTSLIEASVAGAPAYDEESWKHITFTQGTSKITAPAKFQVSCRTVR